MIRLKVHQMRSDPFDPDPALIHRKHFTHIPHRRRWIFPGSLYPDRSPLNFQGDLLSIQSLPRFHPDRQ